MTTICQQLFVHDMFIMGVVKIIVNIIYSAVNTASVKLEANIVYQDVWAGLSVSQITILISICDHH